MPLRTKTVIIIIATLLGLLVALFAASRAVLLHSFADLERREARRNVERLLRAVAGDIAGLNQQCRNAATWDKAYRFIQTAYPDFIKSEIGYGTYSDLAARRLNLEIYVRSTGEVVFGEGFNLTAQKETPVPASLRRHLYAGSRLLAAGGTAGLLMLPEGPLLVAARPVLTSAGDGPIIGSLIMGRYLDAAEVRRLGEQTLLAVTLRPYVPAAAAAAGAPGADPILIRALNPSLVAGYAPLSDIYGQPVVAVELDMPREIYRHGERSVLYLLLSLILVGFVFGSVTLVLLERAILSRLTRLSAGVTSVGESSDLSARVYLSGDDELSGLAGAINRMLEGLEKSQREIVRRRHAQEAALAAQQVAEQSSRAKSAFLANMSHELRTPLNAIIGYSELLYEESEAKNDPGASADLARITRAGKHLLGLINEVLDLSKIEAGKIELFWEDVAPAALLEDTAGAMGALARQNGNKLTLNCPSGLRPIRVDTMKFRQSLGNLLSNACKFTRNGCINVDVVPVDSEGAEWIEWRVSDTGIGIAPDQMHKLFQPFSQVDASTTRKYGGTGLGLAISQRFCQLMGGDITVSSQLGMGSTFTIRLPRHAAAKIPPAIVMPVAVP